jgi:hypothetical protein
VEYLQTFQAFSPILILGEKAMSRQLRNSYESSHLLICGELHGVQENAHALYTLVKIYGCEVLAIERTEQEAGNFMQGVLAGLPDFDAIDREVFGASMLSVQMAKTIYHLYKEKAINEIAYIDTEDDNIEQGLARNILALDIRRKTICIMGNWHTTLEEGNDTSHVSALSYARKKRRMTYVRYRYGGGKYHNVATGMDKIDKDDSINEYRLRSKGNNNFELLIPEATPIVYEVVI